MVLALIVVFQEVAEMTRITVRRKGASIPFTFDRDGESIEGFICTIKVKQFDSDAALISRVITPTGDEWTGFLTSTETDALAASITYRFFGILTNAATDEEEQVETRFSLTASWAA